MVTPKTAAVVLCFLAPALAQVASYEGPTILSRGGGRTGQVGDEFSRIRVYGSLSGVYDSNLTAVTVNQRGEIPSVEGYGVEAGFGAYGVHLWKNASLALNYRGSLRHYTERTFFDGTDHLLSLEFAKQLSRRLTFELRPTAGVLSQSFSPWVAGVVDPTLVALPTEELFAGRTQFVETRGAMTYQKSTRLSFQAAASGFAVRRRSQALVGVNGWSATGDVAYRLGRYRTIGFSYSFMHFDFTRRFGDSDIHQYALNYSQQLGRRWELALMAGTFKVESQGLVRVSLDPVVAQLLGVTEGVEAFHRSSYVGAGKASLTRLFKRSRLGFQYERGVAPGNGIYLTSEQQTGSFNYSYTGARRWHIGLNGAYTTLKSLAHTIGTYQSYNGGVGVSRALVQALHLTMRVDYRDYRAGRLGRDSVLAAVGFAFSPGDLPLSLW